MVQLLIDAGADVNLMDNNKRTPLSFAAENGHDALSCLLLDKGADMHLKDTTHRSSLSYAASKGQRSVVRALLDKGAHIDSLDSQSRTPLNWAAEHGEVTTIQLLLEKGARTNFHGHSRSLVNAIWRGRTEVAGLLISHGARVQDPCFNVGQWKSAIGDNPAMIKLLLEIDFDFDMTDWYHRTALSSAAVEGDVDLIRLLLEGGVKPNIRDGYGETPLMCAARGGHVAATATLLENGAEPISEDEEVQLPLELAAQTGDLATVRLLSTYGSLDWLAGSFSEIITNAAKRNDTAVLELLLNKSAISVRGEALYYALKDGCTNAAEMLLHHDADARGALSAAATYGCKEVVEALLADGVCSDEPAPSDPTGRTPLSYAVGNGCLELVTLFSEHGAAVQCIDHSGRTPLSYASENGHTTVVEFLLGNGCDPDFRLPSANCEGSYRTPLSLAAANGHRTVSELLLKYGAKPDVAAHDGRTPLSFAAEMGHTRMVELLLSKGADPNISTLEGWTPLSSAAERGYIAICRMLLANGADVNTRTVSGKSPILLATDYDNTPEIVRTLLGYDADADIGHDAGTPLMQACLYEWENTVIALLERGVSPNTRDQYGRSAIWYAVGSQQKAVVRALLEFGADPNSADHDGVTPLMRSVKESFRDPQKSCTLSIIKSLLDSGADINASDNRCQTPLSLAVEVGNASAVSLLLSRGASPNDRDEQGRTALLLAVANDSRVMVKSFLAAGFDLSYIEDEAGCSPICKAAAQGSIEIVAMLLEHAQNNLAASISIPRRAFIEAAMNRHEEMVTLLLRADGVDVTGKATVLSSYAQTELQDANGRRPHDHSGETTRRGMDDFTWGSDYNPKYRYLRRMLAWAARQGDVETMRLLLDKLEVGLPKAEGLRELARKRGHQDVVELVDKRYLTRYASRLLTWAAGGGDPERVQSILDQCNVGLQTAREAIWLAKDGGHTAVLEVLAKHTFTDIPDSGTESDSENDDPWWSSHSSDYSDSLEEEDDMESWPSSRDGAVQLDLV
ncbi:uncharacterized protein DSM5745_06294 [Aspergillus mulundensis]|uniref:Uncharacterized protein n=1 Tax=Aspergillus mulundensis TaxID=1810919 RepID=A0A3D8RQD8_9EURO|nr:hypothetical protein DSM5745_06294 [Aspergillus mulundensis]RDW76302.1 hypothetical protein DSM5745_06294 [Aspergillus mulundensis]